MYEENVRLGCTVYKLDRLIFANGERYPGNPPIFWSTQK